MTSLERAVRAGIRELEERDARSGLWMAIATGVAVSMPVARTFIGFGGEAAAAWALPLAGLALLCTTAGTFLAVRAKSTARAVLQVLAWNVIPPTLVCLPSVVGLIFSVPSGFAAFAAVLPFALFARWSSRLERPGHAERDRLMGGLMVALSGAGLVIYEVAQTSDVYSPPNPLAPAPAILAGVVALGLIGYALAKDVHRALLARSLGRGELPGWRVARAAEGRATVERAFEAGAGPHRAAPTRDTVGELVYSPPRIAAALALTVAAASLLASSVAIATWP